MKKKAKKPTKKPTKKAAAKAAAKAAEWPAFGSVLVKELSNDLSEPRYRFRWINTAGRKRQWTISLVSLGDVATVERLILADAARDHSMPSKRRARA